MGLIIAVLTAFLVLHPHPAQSAGIVYGNPSPATAYAHSGALVIAGENNYQSPVFKRISKAGGTVLIYLDSVLRNDSGRYARLLYDRSVCGRAIPRWPGLPRANGYGYVADFAVGAGEPAKLRCVLRMMVRENHYMGGFFADDLGSRSWYPGFSWSRFPAKTAWRRGAIALAKTFREVANEHHLIVIVNGTWAGGSLATAGGGYPVTSRSGLSLADGGMVEHHDGQIRYFAPYACSRQWATASPVTHGVAFNYAVMATRAGVREYARSGCFAFVNYQPTSLYGYAPPTLPFHRTGLPSHTS